MPYGTVKIVCCSPVPVVSGQRFGSVAGSGLWDGLGSAVESGDERFLFWCFDSGRTVFRPDPIHGPPGWMPVENSHAGESSSCAPVSPETTNLHSLSRPGAVEHGPQRGGQCVRVVWHSEVGPVEMIVRPRRPPPTIEVEPVVRQNVPRIGLDGVERHSEDGGSTRQDDRRAMPMQLELLAMMVGVATFCRASVDVPMFSAIGADHD